MLKKMVLLAAMGMGLSCSHIRPHVIPVVKKVVTSAVRERFGNACPVGLICCSPEKGASVGKSRVMKRVTVETYR